MPVLCRSECVELPSVGQETWRNVVQATCTGCRLGSIPNSNTDSMILSDALLREKTSWGLDEHIS
jgi:hypothetical protein